MYKTIRTDVSLKQLLRLFDGNLMLQLLGPIWRVVAAVHLFFQTGDYASSRRDVRAAARIPLS